MRSRRARAIAVGTVSAERKAIARSGVLVGRVEAVQRVEVRARVTGYLEEVLFKEGDLIKEGTPLYRIEKGLFEAAVASAQAAVERSKAAKVLTDLQLRRAQELLDKNTGTVVARDQALAADQQADGQVMGDEANLGDRKDQPRLYIHNVRRSRERSARPTSPRAMSSIPTAVC